MLSSDTLTKDEENEVSNMLNSGDMSDNIHSPGSDAEVRSELVPKHLGIDSVSKTFDR